MKTQQEASKNLTSLPTEIKNKPWLHRWLEGVWYHNSAGKYLLIPFTPLFCFIAFMRRWQHECKRDNSNKIPIIVIGNITVGGTGKTPLVISVVNLLKEAGYSPGIISRGYKGTAKEWPQRVISSTPPHLVGDEPVLMASRTQVPVVVGADRNTDIRYLLNHYDCDVIVSDDGLQHYKMPRSIEMVVIDGDRRFGNGWCLPAGPLRERVSRLQKADFCIVNAMDDSQTEKSEYLMELKGNHLINLSTAKTITLADLTNQKVYAVTGIGNPDRFFSTLHHHGLDIIPHSFVDHHQFQKEDLIFEHDYPVILTEKDAVKCRKFQTTNCWYLPVTAELPDTFKLALLEKLKNLTRVSSQLAQ